MKSNPASPPAPWRIGYTVLAAGLLAACSPALDWRELSVPDSAASALFPCKPDTHVRKVALAGAALQMHLSSCTAADNVYAVSHVDLDDPTRVTEVMQTLRVLAAENVGGVATVVGAPRVPGMAAHPLAERLAVVGRRSDGSAIEAQAIFFTQGAAVYQATVVGTRLDPDAVDTFFSALKLR